MVLAIGGKVLDPAVVTFFEKTGLPVPVPSKRRAEIVTPTKVIPVKLEDIMEVMAPQQYQAPILEPQPRDIGDKLPSPMHYAKAPGDIEQALETGKIIIGGEEPIVTPEPFVKYIQPEPELAPEPTETLDIGKLMLIGGAVLAGILLIKGLFK